MGAKLQRIPVTLRICNRLYHVTRAPSIKVGRSPAYGVVDLGKREICLAEKCGKTRLTRELLLDTLVHEIFHVIMHEIKGIKLNEEEKALRIGKEAGRAICRNRLILSHILKGT